MLDNIIQTAIDIPEDIILKIYEIKRLQEKVALRSNINGWQSPQYSSTIEIPWIGEFFTECLEKLTLTHLEIEHLWFNISPTGSLHRWHSHKGSAQVGVCYLRVPKNSGNIEFRYGNKAHQIEPITGTLITFQAGLEHRVLENMSAEDRITIAFNLKTKS